MKKTDDTLLYFTKQEIHNQLNSNSLETVIVVDMGALMHRYIYGFANEMMGNGLSDDSIFRYHATKFLLDIERTVSRSKLILAFDKKDENKKYWRHEILPHYKENRKKQLSPLPKDFVYNSFNNFSADIAKHFPYKCVTIEGIEADDIIATVCSEFSLSNVIIASSDKDFRQLHWNNNVYQFDPMKNIFIKEKNPQKYLFEHILKGDSSDGIPNILSDEDTFVNNKRQNVLSAKKINTLYNEFKDFDAFGVKSEVSEKEYQRYELNKKIIDLTLIPENIKSKILEKLYAKDIQGTKNTFYQYLIHNSFNDLAEKLL